MGAPLADLATRMAAVSDPGPFPDIRHLTRAVAILDSGRRADAAAEHERLAPVASWRPPWYPSTAPTGC